MKSLRLAAGGLLVAAVIAGVLAVGSRRAPDDERPGTVELRLEPASTWGIVGRFELTGAAPAAEPLPIDFDAQTSSARISLAPGTYVLTLRAGARVACDSDAERAPVDDGLWASQVSIWPQPVAVAPDELTTVRIALPLQPGEDACLSGGGEAEQRRALLEH